MPQQNPHEERLKAMAKEKLLRRIEALKAYVEKDTAEIVLGNQLVLLLEAALPICARAFGEALSHHWLTELKRKWRFCQECSKSLPEGKDFCAECIQKFEEMSYE